VVACGALQRWLGRVSLFVVAVLGHVGATLFVATMELTELAKGRVGLSIAVRPDVGVSYGLAAVAGVLVVRVADTWRRRYVIASLIVIAGEVPHLVELHRTREPHCLADRPGGRGPPSARPWVPGMRFRAEKAPVAMALTRRTSRGPYGDLPEAKGPSQMAASQFPVFVDICGIRCS